MSAADSTPTLQEQNLRLFLDALGVTLPLDSPAEPDALAVTPLGPLAASIFESRDGKVALLSVRLEGVTYPLSIHYLTGESEVLFGHSTLLLDAYARGDDILPRLRAVVQEVFSTDADDLLAFLEPSWQNVPLRGQADRRILWNVKPTLPITVEVFRERLGDVPDLPLFPSVYPYNNPYVENLLEVGLPELTDCKRVLVLGSGSGLDAVCLALKYGIPVDATDINPVAVANTAASARCCGLGDRVRAWVSDGFGEVRAAYDAIFFEAPLATEYPVQSDANRHDLGGKVLREVLNELPAHLSPRGRMYLMSRPDLSLYFPANGLASRVRRTFEAKSIVAIHEIWMAT